MRLSDAFASDASSPVGSAFQFSCVILPAMKAEASSCLHQKKRGPSLCHKDFAREM